MPEPPGKWLVVPSKVAKEVNNNKAPAETKHWIDAGRIANFSVDVERQLFMKSVLMNRCLRLQTLRVLFLHIIEKVHMWWKKAELGILQRIWVLDASMHQHFLKKFSPGYFKMVILGGDYGFSIASCNHAIFNFR